MKMSTVLKMSSILILHDYKDEKLFKNGQKINKISVNNQKIFLVHLK